MNAERIKKTLPLLIILVLVLGLGWIWQNNLVVAATYQLEKGRQELKKLREENENLVLSSFNQPSLEQLEKTAQKLGLENTGKTFFIETLSSAAVSVR